MDKQGRLNKIIDYISAHPGCNAEKAFRGVEKWMARATFFDHLKELKEEVLSMRDRKINQRVGILNYS